MDERASISVQNPPPPGMSGFALTCRPPAAGLSCDVAEIIGYQEMHAAHFRQREAASLVAPLVISFGDPFLVALGRPAGDNDRHATFAAGLYAGPVFIDSFGGCSCVQVNFTPQGAYRFFGLPMSELADTMVPLDALLGRDAVRLRDRLGEEPDWNRRLDMVEAFVAARLCAAAPASPTVAAAYGAVLRSGGTAPVAAIAEHVGWSRKHLTQRFHAEIGLAPKAVARIVRFNRVTALADRDGNGWADVAAACGYADQAHLVREFRALAGDTPAVWRARLS